MRNDLMKWTASSSLQKAAMEDTLKCNAFTKKYGLVLSEKQAMDLVEARAKSLESFGRIEFCGGVVEKLIWAFCDSPYIIPDNYLGILHELIECFYFYKNDTMDLCSDDEMIAFMAAAFNGVCQGSVALLREREMEKFATNLRYGRPTGYEDDA